jgi:hypothetical protein
MANIAIMTLITVWSTRLAAGLATSGEAGRRNGQVQNHAIDTSALPIQANRADAMASWRADV